MLTLLCLSYSLNIGFWVQNLGIMMWHQFSIKANINLQTELIRGLKKWITELEERKIISGFAFNHYFKDEIDDHLAIRFECSKKQCEIIKKEMLEVLSKLDYNQKPELDIWKGENHILHAYEVGSRCTFLIWDLIDKGRISNNYLSNFYTKNKLHQIPSLFQTHFFHGLMNSLRIHKYPNEQILHLISLLEWTKSKNINELYKNLSSDKILRSIHINHK